MNLRREQIYVTSDILRSLWQIARLRSGGLDDQGLTHIINPDEIAVQLLRKGIQQDYPWLDEVQKGQDRLETEAFKQQKADK